MMDRFQGCIVGLAIGDALGHPTEFLSMSAIHGRFGPKGVQDLEASGRHPAGTFTDDTQMAVCVARALIREGCHLPGDLERWADCTAREFVAWSVSKDNNRAPGGTCLAGCRNLAKGVPWRQAGVKSSKGCGAAMRAAPVGLYFSRDDDALVRAAAVQAALTHAHPTGIASAVAAAAPVAWVVRTGSLDGLIEHTRSCLARLDVETLVSFGSTRVDAERCGATEMLQALDRLERCLDQDTDDVCQLLGGAWVGEEAVATALWCVLKSRGDFRESVLRGANSSGDSDSIACIAGSVAGALQGLSNLPESWRNRVEKAEELGILAERLHQSATQHTCLELPPELDFFGLSSRS